MLAAVVLVGGAWWAASDDDVTTVRVGGDVGALADGPSANGAPAGWAANDQPGGPLASAGTGPAADRNGPPQPEGGPPGHNGDVIAAGRRPPTTTTTTASEGTPTTDPDSTTSSTIPTLPPTTGPTGGGPTPPSTGHPGGGPPTTSTSTTTTTSRPGPGPERFLAYTRVVSQTDPADTDLFVGDLEGRHERRLTSGPDSDQFPAWSPDGSTIAFTRVTLGGSTELWSIRADGSGLRQLTFSGAGAKHEPAWSPDGRFLAFTAAYFNPTRVWIEVLDLATGRMTPVTTGPMDGQPLWSPDGTTIVYTARSANGEDDDLFAVNRDGTGRRSITAAPFDYESERYAAYGWSADGSRLLVYYQHPEEGHIITLRPDGTGRQDILSDRVPAPGQQGSGTLQFLTWSPDERMIVFNSYNGLRAVNTDGSGLRLLDPPDGGRYMADWQPG
ncbi:MAG TPA: hypothetical protein VG034_23225 [Acidimicrobiia bacterium]|nr:hypothetical protein [Acidimicrobiia bacterium]